MEDIDIVNVLRSIYMNRIINKVLFTQKSRIFMKFQRKFDLNDEQSSDSDYQQNNLAMKLRSKNPFVKLGAFLRLQKMLNDCEGQKLSSREKSLVLGIFSKAERKEVLKTQKEAYFEENLKESTNRD